MTTYPRKRPLFSTRKDLYCVNCARRIPAGQQISSQSPLGETVFCTACAERLGVVLPTTLRQPIGGGHARGPHVSQAPLPLDGGKESG